MNAELKQIEDALRIAVVIERADGRRRSSRSLGFAQINYGRLFVRDYWTLFSLAREMDCQVSDLLPKERDEMRSKWDAIVRSAESILAAVRSLPVPLREVTDLRSLGKSWKRIADQFPHRIVFSMKEDYEESLRTIGRRASEAISLISSVEKISVVRGAERA